MLFDIENIRNVYNSVLFFQIVSSNVVDCISYGTVSCWLWVLGLGRRRKGVRLDDIDLEILRILYNDGRESLVSIGKKINLTHPSVKDRLRRLYASGLMKIQANINPRKLGYHVGFIMLDISDSSRVKDIIDSLSGCPRVIFIGHVSGDYNMIIVIAAPDAKFLRSFIEKNIRGITGLKKLDFALGDIVYPEYVPIRIVGSDECVERCMTCELRTKLKLCPGCVEFLKMIKSGGYSGD